VTLSSAQRAAVTVEVAQMRTLWADITTPGKVAFNSNKVTPVFSQFSGRIVQLEAEVGTSVRVGQRIGTIDTPDIVTMQSDYLQGLTAVRSAHTTLELARVTSQRLKHLAAVEAVPQRDLQQALSDESRAADDLQRAESVVAAARGRLQSAGMKEADIGSLELQPRAVNRLLPLRAPISGTIIERKAGVGQVVQSTSGDPLFMIADLSTVWVNADVYEDQLAHIHTGGPVKITTSAYAGEVFTARVDQIGSTFDADKHTVAVRCVVPNPQHRLKPGMFATVILASASPQTVVTVPASAVVVEGDQRSVFVEEEGSRYSKRAVETGSEIQGSVVVRGGLREGEHVVVHGGLLLSAGKTK
jgi:cobalt-zinc-cadmium efflux system membrane fusion protein